MNPSGRPAVVVPYAEGTPRSCFIYCASLTIARTSRAAYTLPEPPRQVRPAEAVQRSVKEDRTSGYQRHATGWVGWVSFVHRIGSKLPRRGLHALPCLNQTRQRVQELLPTTCLSFSSPMPAMTMNEMTISSACRQRNSAEEDRDLSFCWRSS